MQNLVFVPRFLKNKGTIIVGSVIIVTIFTINLIGSIARVNLVRFDTRRQIEQKTGFDLSSVCSFKGYFMNVTHGYSWIKLECLHDKINVFFQQNNLIKQSNDNYSLEKAMNSNSVKSSKKNVIKNTEVLKGWISEEFIPMSAYNNQKMSVLIGKENKNANKYSIYIFIASN